MKALILSCPIIVTLALGALNAIHADSATWNLNPRSNDWNTAVNWTPATVPNGPSDVATFARSSIKSLEFSAAMTEVAEIVFTSGASSFQIAVDPILAQTVVYLTISGTGITNSSGVPQNLVSGPTIGTLGTGVIQFLNAATAGDGTVITALGASTDGAFSGSEIHFYDTSTAGSATIAAEGATGGDDAGGGRVFFHDDATAANANITVTNSVALGGLSGEIIFFDSSSANDAIFNVEGGNVFFSGNSEAATAQFILSGGEVDFFGTSTAVDASFVMDAGLVNFLDDTTSAGNGLFIINGGNVQFFGGTAGNATLTANSNGGDIGRINFNESDESEARIELFGEGTLYVGTTGIGSVSVGSIEGDGLIELGDNQLITGANNLSTTFSGTIQDTGSLTKIGTGTLTLSGANTYTGGTTIKKGTLFVKSEPDSGTGSGKVAANTGTLGGTGTIGGAVTIGKGNGTGAFLSPGTNGIGTLTLKDTLTFKLDGTYQFELNSTNGKADKVIAKGVTIRSGAQCSITDRGSGVLTAGTKFTAIRNTATSAISGVFANLPDGSTITIGNNTFQANYESGDGNDLTLTVVP